MKFDEEKMKNWLAQTDELMSQIPEGEISSWPAQYRVTWNPQAFLHLKNEEVTLAICSTGRFAHVMPSLISYMMSIYPWMRQKLINREIELRLMNEASDKIAELITEKTHLQSQVDDLQTALTQEQVSSMAKDKKIQDLEDQLREIEEMGGDE